MMLIMNVMTVIILWVGAQQVAAATMQVGDMIAFRPDYAALAVALLSPLVQIESTAPSRRLRQAQGP